MANPLGTEFLSIPLRNFSVAQMQSADAFVARRLLTKIPVAQQSAPYYVYPAGDWMRPEAQPLGRGAESAGGGWHLSSDNYNAIVYAVHKDNDAQDYAASDAAGILNLDQDAASYVTEQLQILEDIKFRDRFMPAAGGVWTTQFQGVTTVPVPGTSFTQWDDPNSKPINDIVFESLALAKRNKGRKPNILIISPEVELALMQNPQIISRYEFTSGGVLTRQLIAAALGVDRIEVVWSMANEAKEGLTDDVDFIFPKTALLAYIAPAGGPKTNTAAAMFTWTQMDGGSSIGTRVDRIPMPWIHSIRVEGMAAFDMKVVNAAAATQFLDAVS